MRVSGIRPVEDSPDFRSPIERPGLNHILLSPFCSVGCKNLAESIRVFCL